MNVKMSKDKIQQLLKAVGSRPRTDDTSIECTDFNWNEPRYFSKDQLDKLGVFTENLVVALSEKFSAFCRVQFEVEIVSVNQKYASEYFAEANENQKKNYYLSFGSGPGKEFGMLEIPGKTAALWAKQLLGDSDSNEGQEKELSQLEQSLLCDLASVLVSAFSAVNSKIESNPANNIIAGKFPMNIKESEEVCEISFSIKQKDSQAKSDASFIIPCKKLEAVTGKNKYSQNESPEQDYSKTILEHLNYVSVCVTAQLACSQFSFEDIMDLRENDIIMLDKQIDEPIDLIINNCIFGYGIPVKSDGQYAVRIAATEI